MSAYPTILSSLSHEITTKIGAEDQAEAFKITMEIAKSKLCEGMGEDMCLSSKPCLMTCTLARISKKSLGLWRPCKLAVEGCCQSCTALCVTACPATDRSKTALHQLSQHLSLA